MAEHVCMGAMMQCTFGAAPSSLIVLPTTMELAGVVPGANIMCNIPIANIPPFGTCMSPSNPMVAAATAAALGVLTPMPCIPVTAAPWVPGAVTAMLGTFPALDNSSKLMCTWGGVISITSPGEFTTSVP
jgi:hypothetical protein